MQVVDYIFVSIAFYQNFVEVCLNLCVKVLSRVSRDEKATLFCFSFVAFHVHSNLAVDLFFTVPAYSNKRFETFTFRYVLFFFFFLIAFTMKVWDTQQSEAPNLVFALKRAL